MKVNDRGSQKWTAIMLPEHIAELKKIFSENGKEHKEKPILDDQQLMDNEIMLKEAIENNLTVEITYYNNNQFNNVDGKITFVDVQNRYLLLDDTRINLDDIIEVNL